VKLKIALICLSAFAFVLCISAIVGYRYLDGAANSSGTPEVFNVARGMPAAAVAETLASRGIIKSAPFAYYYVRLHRLSLKAGSYRVSPAMATSGILRLIAEGKQEYRRVTIPEGLTLAKTARHLAEAGVVDAASFETVAADRALLERFGIPGSTAEGYLFPDTYFFPYDADALSVVETMLTNFFDKTASLTGLPQDAKELYDRVILASIVEREYRVAAEAPRIASVFENRLAIGMGLQSCATIEYIITEIQGKPHPTRLTNADLEISSDYNTYKWAGLPPGPISSPGLVALGAAMNPADSDYLYFRLTDPSAGSHTFSRSLEEHVEAGHLLTLKKAAGN